MRKKRSQQRNDNSEKNPNRSGETAPGANIYSNDDTGIVEKIFDQLPRRRNRKKRESNDQQLNHLRVDDVDIDLTNANIPTLKFNIEVNLSSLPDFQQELGSVEIPGNICYKKMFCYELWIFDRFYILNMYTKVPNFP